MQPTGAPAVPSTRGRLGGRDDLDAVEGEQPELQARRAREPQGGRTVLALLNASFDAANGLELAIATTAAEARVYDMQAGEKIVRASKPDGPYRRFLLPAVEPWTMRLVVVGNP